jgi:hypothetical protein
MGELSFLTIIVSLAVCSLLVYAVFQYMKVRFTILEQSHKEQAMILQQYIEESATDIQRLYKLTTSGSNIHHPQGSIILEYANMDADADGMKQKQSAYNEPHLIHLDTAIFSNNRSSNLIEISSDSEDTTESESTTEDEEDGDDATSQDDESTTEDEDEDEDEDTEKATEDADADGDADGAEEKKPLGYEQCLQIDTQSQLLVEEICSELEKPSHIKLVTVDLGASDEPIQGSQEKNAEFQNDVLSMLYKKAQNTENPEIVAETITTTTTPSVSLHHLSVQELRQMLKEKYKHQPEKYAENQKLKKGELIQLLSAL